MSETYELSNHGTWGSNSLTGNGRTRARKMVTHITTAILGLTATALMSGGLHYENSMQETPHLVGETKIAEAAIGWSAISTAFIPAIQAAAKWPTKKATAVVSATGSLTAIGVALTAVASSVEALHAPENVAARMFKYVTEYGTSAELAREIDTIQVEYSCCGANNGGDYEQNREHLTGEVPDSCCKTHDRPCDHLFNEHVNKDGCAKHLGEEVTTYLQVLTALLIAHTWALAMATAAAAAANLRGCNSGQ